MQPDDVDDMIEMVKAEQVEVVFCDTHRIDAITPAVVLRFLGQVICLETMFVSDLSSLDDFPQPNAVYWERIREHFGVDVEPRTSFVEILQRLDQ